MNRFGSLCSSFGKGSDGNPAKGMAIEENKQLLLIARNELYCSDGRFKSWYRRWDR